MKGLPFKAVKSIEKLIEGKFDFLALNFLGMIPKQKSKSIVFSSGNSSIVFLYLKALGKKRMTKEERDLLKVILNVASGYIDSLKDRTKSKVINSIDSYMRDVKLKDRTPKIKEIKKLVDKEMKSAKKHFELIANSESNKSINFGTAMKIARVTKRHGDEDPTVFFMVTIDDVTGDEEFVLHLLPDRITPRVWKLSEIGSEYHKKGDSNPKFAGLHPNCRCKLAYLPKGFGFNKNGKIHFKGLEHDEYKEQRKEFGTPRSDVKKAVYHEGKWHVESTDNHGDEHPDNENRHPADHELVHQAANGQKYWKPKHFRWAGELLSESQGNKKQTQMAKKWVLDNGHERGSRIRDHLASLSRTIKNDPDRHLRVSETSNHPDRGHTEMRQRHFMYALQGKEGYSIEPHFDEETSQYKGLNIYAPRHHKSGDLGETKWHWDGNSLKTVYNKMTGKRWK